MFRPALDVNNGLGKPSLVRVLTAIRFFAAGLAIIMITVMGIKYMMAAPTEKAEVKTKLINFIIGIALVVAATTIIDVVRDFVIESTKIGTT